MPDATEKRHYKRYNAHLELNVSSLFKQDNIQITNVDSPIEVCDVSRSGIGFTSKSVLPVDYYFNARLQLGSPENTLFCVVKIVRCNALKDSDTYSYGCEFVGLSSIFMYIFDDYEANHNK